MIEDMSNTARFSDNTNPPQWLLWAREIQALAQSGYHYAEDEYHRERYQRLNEIAAEMFVSHSDLEYEPVVDLFSKQIGYATPRVDVRGAVFLDDMILLVREREDGGWTLPGGWADVGDVPSQAAEREVWEEAGYRVKAIRVIGIYDANRLRPLELFHAFKIVFLCELIDGHARTSRETSDVAFFEFDQIPAGLSGERTRPRHIVDVFNAHRDTSKPTIFD